MAVKIKPRDVKTWLRSLDVEDGTRYKYKTVMGTVFRFSQAEGSLPLGEAHNPVTYVTGIPATSDYEGIVLTPEQALKVLDQLQQPEYTMIALVAVTGIRSGEMLGLRWRDMFASRKTSGRTPRYGSVVVEDHLRPAAVRAGVLETKDCETFIDGELVKRFGFHTFRYSLTSWLMANGENPQIVRAMLHWTNLNMLAHYTQGFKADKLEAQETVLKKLVRPGNPSDREPER